MDQTGRTRVASVARVLCFGVLMTVLVAAELYLHYKTIPVFLDYLRETLAAMDEGFAPDAVLTELEGALGALGELSGRSVREDVTNGIFARFCVGK